MTCIHFKATFASQPAIMHKRLSTAFKLTENSDAIHAALRERIV